MFIEFIKKYAFFIFNNWGNEEVSEFISQIKPQKGIKIIDLGCGDGRLTLLFAERAKAGMVIGADAESMREYVMAKGIKFVPVNLNHKLPFPDESFDVVLSHFSLEHLYNTGLFIRESRRILKKNGYTLIATDNLADWSNIIALLMGWQPFITAYGVANKVLGNPLSIAESWVVENLEELGELSHNKVLAYKMLSDAYIEFGFKIKRITGVGYLPFFGSLARFFSNIDKKHARFLILKAVK